MALIVQKYGGTSVGTVERIEQVAKRVADAQARGDQVCVTVSAMSGETNRLVELGKAVDLNAARREIDVLLSTGEQVTIALLCIALHKLGCPARSYTGRQAGILTDDAHSKARILDIDASSMRDRLATGEVAVVPDVWAPSRPTDEVLDPTPIYLADPLAESGETDGTSDLLIDTQPSDVPNPLGSDDGGVVARRPQSPSD